MLVTVTFKTTADALVGTPPLVAPDGLVPAAWIVRELFGPSVLPSHWVRSRPERFEGLFALVSQIR